MSRNEARSRIKLEIKRTTYNRLVRFSKKLNLPFDLVVETFLTQALEAVGEDEEFIPWPIHLEVHTD